MSRRNSATLTRHATADGTPRWALDGTLLPPSFDLGFLLSLSREAVGHVLDDARGDETADGPLLAPIESTQEIWASGVTYLRSREARVQESSVADVYDTVYDAGRPELFFKSVGWRAVGHGGSVRIRRDSAWNVPEPELVLVMNRFGEILGYSAGNDMSSRDIEGENPLYLPQAKIYDGACGLGPAIVLAHPDELRDLAIDLRISRDGAEVFHGTTRTSAMKRTFEELARALHAELSLPQGAFLMTGTGIVPPDDFTLAVGDRVRIDVGALSLENRVAS